MATSTYGTPYVQGSDLVSAYPTVSSSLATRVDEVSYKGNGLNAQTGTTYTLVAGDAGKTITLSNASPVAVTLPQDSTADLPDGAVVTFYNLGAGVVTISQGTGATLQGGSITLAQYAVTSVIKLSANTYGKFDGGGVKGLTIVSATSIANSGGSASQTSGIVSFSGVTTVSVNGIFTAGYDNYRIIIGNTASGSANLLMRLRTAGTDNANTDYRWSGTYTGSGSAVYNGETSGSATSFAIGYSAASTQCNTALDLFGPYAAVQAIYMASNMRMSTTESNENKRSGGMTVTTSYDGFTLFAASGTITGSIRVYGYENQ